jgi:hypothetical protein
MADVEILQEEDEMIFTGKTYDILKWIAQVVLPALGTLYVAIDQAVDWHHASLVGSIVLAADTFLGIILGLSSAQFNAQQMQQPEKQLNKPVGDLLVGQDGEEIHFGLGLNQGGFDSITDKTTVTLNVVKLPPSQ